MGKGYAEGPAAEEAERRREELGAGDEVDADALFASGAAWGIRLVRRSGLSPSR